MTYKQSLLAALLATPAFCFGQQIALNAAPEPLSTAPETAIVTPATELVRPAVPPAPTPTWQTRFGRWFDVNEFDFSLRYRSVFDSNNAHEYDQGQERGIVDGKFKFDRAGRYGIAFHGSTGKYFNWAYADFMGGGNEKGFDRSFAKADPTQQNAITTYLTPTRVAEEENVGGWSFYVRRLYLDLQPIDDVEVEYGSFDLNRGAASEITTYDYDGYIAGGRVLIKRPKNFFFDEASITYAYFGDLYKPNFFVRGDRLAHSNYHQFLLRKQVGEHINASFDYTWQDASNTYREDAEFRLPKNRFLDTARAEFYERSNAIAFRGVDDFAPGGKGYAFTLTKKDLDHRLSLEGGYASIEPHQGVLTQDETSATFCMGVNGDSYGLGNRYFVRPVIHVTPYMDLFGFYTHEVGKFTVPDQVVWNKEALNAGFLVDLKKVFFPKSAA